AIGNNPAGGTLSGTTIVTVVNGVATFGNLSIDKAGNGYTLTASSGLLAGATSASFNVVAGGTVIEDFETTHSWFIVGGSSPTAYRSSVAAHNGSLGLVDYAGNDWIYRSDGSAAVNAG